MKKPPTNQANGPPGAGDEFVHTLVIRMRRDSSCACSFPRGVPSNICRAMLEAAHEVLTLDAVKKHAQQQRILVPHGVRVPPIVQ